MWKQKDGESVVVFLQRTQLSIFRASTGKLDTVQFDPKIVQDLEMINEDSFCKYLSNFLQQTKLVKASVIVLLDSSVYFLQKAGDITTGQMTDKEKPDKKAHTNVSDMEELENKKRQFAQSVPFANVFSTIITIGKEKFFLALNRDFYEPVIKVFSEKELHVVAILPILAVMPLFEKSGFTPQTATVLISTVEKYRAHDLLENSMKKEEPTTVTALPSNPSDKKRLVVMVGVFVLLIGVLVAVILWSRQRDQQTVVSSPTPVVEETLLSTPSPTPLASPEAISSASLSELLTSSESAKFAPGSISVTVINSSGGIVNTAEFVQKLKGVGFTTVKSTEGSSITGPLTVSVSPALALEIKEALQKQLSEWGYQPRFVENPDQTNSIEITLTNQ